MINIINFFDLHCDTPYACYFKNQDFLKNSLAVSGEKGKCFKKWKQTFAFWISDDAKEPFKLYQNLMYSFKQKTADLPPNLTPVFSVEGGAVIGNDINLLYKLSDDGIRFLTLTWNGENRIAGGSGTHAGLSAFGKNVIKKMNELHIATDFSHLNDKSFFSAIDIAEYPIATHSNCRAICDVPRNLTDEQLKLISQRRGIVGLCFYPLFLDGDFCSKIYENIWHMLNLGLEDNIAIGTDFDGADMYPCIDEISKIPQLYYELSKKGINNGLLDKIFFKNADNYILNL